MRGYIKKRGKSSWAIWVDIGADHETGKRRQKTFTVRGTRREAERRLREILTVLEGGGYIASGKMTVGQWLEDWLKGYAAPNTAARTYERYQQIVRLHLAPALGRLLLTELRPHHIQACYASALDSGRRDRKVGGLSPTTVLQHHRVLSEALKHAVRQGLVLRNAAEAVEPPRITAREMVALDIEEVARLLEAARAGPFYVLIYTGVYTGLRRSELLALRWGDVDLDLATLSVVRTLHRLRDGQIVYRQPKSKRSRRIVDLPPSLAILLRQHREQQEAVLMLLGRTLTEADLVFSLHGAPIDPDSVSQAFRRLARSLNLPTTRFHDLRHTHATLMLRQGVHPKVVSERLGHASVAITLDIYSHVVPGIQAAAARGFDELLQGVPGRVPGELVSNPLAKRPSARYAEGRN